jgi:hypothetical protein
MSLRIALVSLGVCLFSSPVLADECSESLMAETCTCQSAIRSDLAKPLRPDKHSPIHAAARISSKPATHVAKHAPVITPPAD